MNYSKIVSSKIVRIVCTLLVGALVGIGVSCQAAGESGSQIEANADPFAGVAVPRYGGVQDDREDTGDVSKTIPVEQPEETLLVYKSTQSETAQEVFTNGDRNSLELFEIIQGQDISDMEAVTAKITAVLGPESSSLDFTPYITTKITKVSTLEETRYMVGIVSEDLPRAVRYEKGHLLDSKNTPVTLRIELVEGTEVIAEAEVQLPYKPYEIYSWYDLQSISNDLSGTYELMSDIRFPDIGTEGFEEPGFTPIGIEFNRFVGRLIGNGYSISNLYINKSEKTDGERDVFATVGLFGAIGSDDGAIEPVMVIDNLKIVDAEVIGCGNVGVLVGYMTYASITNVTVEDSTLTTLSTCGSSISAKTHVGGVVGSMQQSRVDATINNITINLASNSQGSSAGGIVGEVNYNSHITGTVSGTISGIASDGWRSMHIAGLVGEIYHSSSVVGSSSATVSLQPSEDSPPSGPISAGGLVAGGLVGRLHGDVTVIGYSTGTLSDTLRGGSEAGGIIGSIPGLKQVAKDFDIRVYGYSTGDITGGGLVGVMVPSYKSLKVYGYSTGNVTAGGIIGRLRGNKKISSDSYAVAGYHSQGIAMYEGAYFVNEDSYIAPISQASLLERRGTAGSYSYFIDDGDPATTTDGNNLAGVMTILGSHGGETDSDSDGLPDQLGSWVWVGDGKRPEFWDTADSKYFGDQPE